MGLASGFVATAGLALIIHFVIQPAMQKETWGREQYRFESFDLWYDEDSPLIESRNELNQQLTSELEDLLVSLEIQRDEIPEKIDVFVHDSTSQLMRSVGLRKGQDTMNSEASLDLLVGESPRICLAELLVCHGWGKCTSQVAYRGLITYLAHPGRNFHTITAALPETMQISLEDIISLEAGGLYPETLYQKFVSPYSKRYILTLDALASYFSISDRIGESENQNLSSLLAASLIQFIIEDVSSIQALKENWTRASTATIIEITAAGSLDEVSRSWYEQAAITGRGGDFPLWKARFAAQSGDYMLAHSLIAEWKAENLTEDRLELSLLCAILFGDFSMAEQLLSSSGDEMMSQDLSSWTSTVIDMTHVMSEEVLLSANLLLDEAQLLCLQLQDMMSRIQTSLGIQMDELPHPLRVFIYEDSTARDQGKLLTQPDLYPNPSLHLILDDNAMEALALSICSLSWGETRSSLLEEGVLRVLIEEEQTVRASACSVFKKGDWNSWVRLCLQPAEDPVVAIEMGLYVSCILDLYDNSLLRRLWHRTTVWGGSHSIQGAMHSEGMSFSALEERVQYELDSCGLVSRESQASAAQ